VRLRDSILPENGTHLCGHNLRIGRRNERYRHPG
jgi:hypothetical protein